MSDRGTVRTFVQIENPAKRGVLEPLGEVLVDTGAELSWIPAPFLERLGVERAKRLRFRQADGTVLDRWTGFAMVHAAPRRPLPRHRKRRGSIH